MNNSFLSFLIDNAIQKIKDTISLSALAGRICYSKSSVEEIIKNDERIKQENIKNYLQKLIQKGHLSIFEHSVLPLDYKTVTDIFFKNFTLQDLINDFGSNVSYIFEVLGYNFEQTYPVLNEEKERKGVYDLIKALLKSKFPVIAVTDSNIYFNLRHIIEYYNDSNYDVLKYDVKEAEPLQILKTIKLSTGANLHILKLYFSKESIEGATFILEGVSRVLTHQLVRHRLYCSYSQKSQRYTKIHSIDDFILPKLDYIKLKRVRKNYLTKIQETYDFVYNKYNQLVEKTVDDKGREFGVYKEDARFILPGGTRTTIMVTILADGFDRFLDERADSHAQWEIKEVAEHLKSIKEGKLPIT